MNYDFMNNFTILLCIPFLRSYSNSDDDEENGDGINIPGGYGDVDDDNDYAVHDDVNDNCSGDYQLVYFRCDRDDDDWNNVLMVLIK